jgi:membrane protein implicated in regulation of membrane protease activity
LELSLLAIAVLVFTLFGNVVGSFLFEYSSLYTVLLVVIWGLLRRRVLLPRANPTQRGHARLVGQTAPIAREAWISPDPNRRHR